MDKPFSGHQSAGAREVAAATVRADADAVAAAECARAAAEFAAAAAAARYCHPAHSEAVSAKHVSGGTWGGAPRPENVATGSTNGAAGPKTPRYIPETSARAGSKTWSFAPTFSLSWNPTMAKAPRPDLVALAISALAAAVSVACAIRDARSDPEPVAVTEPEPGPEPEPIDAR